MRYVDTGVAKTYTGKGCCKCHVRSRLHIHAVEHSPAEIATQVFQRLLAPHITDGVTSDVDRTLIRFMLRTGIIRPARVGFERVGKHIEAWIGRCLRWKRDCIQWVDDGQSGTQVAV